MTFAAPPLRDPAGPTRLRQICLTAAEAYPALEEEFLSAKRDIHASFRIFDPETRLYSPAARALGDTWLDLLRHVLGRGVDIHLILADFDAIARPELHRLTTRSARLLRDLGASLPETAGTLTVEPAPHPARMGLLPRILLLPVIRKHLRRQCDMLNALPPAERDAALRDMPGLVRSLTAGSDGTLRPKRFSIPQVLPATHHQKLAVFDGACVYIGGLDLNDRRFDTPGHDRPADETWHDVQLILDGPVALEARQHLQRFCHEAAGKLPPFQPRELLRTLSTARRIPLPFIGPRNAVDDLREAHLRHLRTATGTLYIETQFFRDLPLAQALALQGRQEPKLNAILILPAAPEEVAFSSAGGLEMRHGEALQIRCLDLLRDAFGPRLFVGAPAQPRAVRDQGERDVLLGAPIIYVHAKLAVFDRRTAIVSSANLNGRSLSWDTEAGVALTCAEDAARLSDRCMTHWIGPDLFAPERAEFQTAARWRQLALDNARRAPRDRQGFVLPYPWGRNRDFSLDVPGFPDKVV